MHTKLKRLLLATVGVSLLFGTATALSPLQEMRQRYDLASEPVKGLSPQLALATQVLGWGRGLIIDAIWIRMESLKQQNRTFELVQLADWACKLAPRFPRVWDYQAWNLAYNVGSQVTHLPDRWAWVMKGIELLRDQGIPMNPNSPMLYERLAWIIFHKIGEQDDNAHFFYKQKFGLYMHEILGGEADAETLQQLADAPRTREDALADDQVQRLWNECEEYGFDIVDGFFDWYVGRPSVPPAVRELLKREYNAAPLRRIELYARARRLREECKLDPNRMLALRERYGPFDWRSPYPHAIYWASVGLEQLDALEQRTFSTVEEFGLPEPKPKIVVKGVPEDEKFYEFRRVSLLRIIYGSMQSLVAHGRLLFDSHGRLLLEAGSDYRFADATLPLYDEIIEAHGTRFRMGTEDGLRFFLIRGMLEFFYMGDTRKSIEYFKLVKERFPWEVKDRSYDDYRDYRSAWHRGDMTTSQFRRLVRGRFVQFWFELACNEDEKAAAIQNEIKRAVREWNEDAEPNLRGIVRYDKMLETMLQDMLSGRLRYPKEVRDNLEVQARQYVGDKKFERLMQSLRKPKEGVPEPEEVEEKWQVETY